MKYILMVFIGMIISIIYRIPPIRMSFDIKGSNTKVEIVFGDLFDQDGDIAIAVNDFFDYNKEIIKDFTLHGMFIDRFFEGPEEFVTEIDQSLARGNNQGEKVDRKKSTGDSRERNIKYPVGTTANIDKLANRYFLFVLTYDTLHQGTTAGVMELWKSLEGLWDEVRKSRKSDTINIPLVGSGFADIGLPDQLLLQIILSSVLASTKKRRFARIVRIVLLPEKLETIELGKLEEAWSSQ